MARSKLHLQFVHPPVLRYGIAAASFAIALGLAFLAQRYGFQNVEVPLFLFAVAITAWHAGSGPAALAAVLSITARLGSNVTEVGAVGAVRRTSSKPGTSVISFSADPMNEAILRASSVRNSRARSGDGVMLLLGFFTIRVSFVPRLRSRAALDAPMILSLARGIGNKSEGSGYRCRRV